MSKTFHFGPELEDGSWVHKEYFGGLTGLFDALDSVLASTADCNVWVECDFWVRRPSKHEVVAPD